MSEAEIDRVVYSSENMEYVGTNLNDISLRLGSTTDDERECYGINKKSKQRSLSSEAKNDPNDLFIGMVFKYLEF
jgi:hypothetical protein